MLANVGAPLGCPFYTAWPACPRLWDMWESGISGAPFHRLLWAVGRVVEVTVGQMRAQSTPGLTLSDIVEMLGAPHIPGFGMCGFRPIPQCETR